MPLDLSEHRLLLVHAHPDDESIGQGATMAKYVAEGRGVTVVTDAPEPALDLLVDRYDGWLDAEPEASASPALDLPTGPRRHHREP